MSQIFTAALAVSLFHLPNATPAHASAAHPVSVNGQSFQLAAANDWVNVKSVQFPGGSFEKSGSDSWTEYSDGGGSFQFVEIGQDTGSIYLRDQGRGVNIQLDLDNAQINYSDDTGANYRLYEITGINDSSTQPTAPASSVKIVEYTCNEGIPLVLEFEEVGNDFFVTWTHDQFRGNRLPQVVSGSGNRFSDGRNEISTKASTAVLNLDGIEDVCTEVSAAAQPARPAQPSRPAEPEDVGLRWAYSQFNDEFNKGRTTSNLALAIPETDAVQISGICTAGSSGNFSVVTFGANIDGLSEGQNVVVDFSTEKFRQQMTGQVFGTQAEVGVSGVQIVIDNNDPLWGAMRRDLVLRYTANGTTTTASLRGSNGPIKNFIEDCKFYAGVGTNTAPPKQQPQDDPRWASCNMPENQRSRDSGTQVTVTFINNSGEFRSVQWLDYNGAPIAYADLNPGEQYKVNTLLGHPWMFTDGPGNCIEIYQPQAGVGTFEISAPSPGFGPE